MRTPQKRSSSRGSHATWSDGDSRTCLHCGKQLRISVDPAIWIHTDHITGRHTSSHAGRGGCGPPWDTQPADTVKSPQTPQKRSAVTETPTEPAPDPDPQPDEPDPDEPDDGDDDGDE